MPHHGIHADSKKNVVRGWFIKVSNAECFIHHYHHDASGAPKPTSRWSRRCIPLALALVGLGVAAAHCRRHIAARARCRTAADAAADTAAAAGARADALSRSGDPPANCTRRTAACADVRSPRHGRKRHDQSAAMSIPDMPDLPRSVAPYTSHCPELIYTPTVSPACSSVGLVKLRTK